MEYIKKMWNYEIVCNEYAAFNKNIKNLKDNSKDTLKFKLGPVVMYGSLFVAGFSFFVYMGAKYQIRL